MNKINSKIGKIIVLMLVLSILIPIGCQKEELSEAPSASRDLLLKLQDFNELYKLNNMGQNDIISTKGFWSTIGDALVVSGADLLGAAAGAVAVKEIAIVAGLATGGTGAAVVMGTGAVIAGGGASVAAYRGLKSASMSHNISTLYFGNLSIKYPVKYEILADCGYNHNKEVFSILNGTSSDSYIKSSTFESNGQSIFESSEWQSVIQKIEYFVDEYKLSKNTTKLIESLKKKSLITDEISLVLNIFFDIYTLVEQNAHVEDIINFYIESIATADCLNETEKVALICSFSVASESIFLWLNQYNDEAGN